MQSGYAHERGFAQTRTSLMQDEKNSPVNLNYGPLVEELRTSFSSRKTFSYEWRMKELSQLRRMVVENDKRICEAVMKDLGKHEVEAFQGETMAIVGEVDFAMKNLKSWMDTEFVTHPLTLKPGESKIVKQPKGVTLIIGPWNFPINLTFLPLVCAVSAGCAAIIKPSELSSHASQIIEELVHQYMDNSLYRVVQGAVAETTALLRERFDHIFYTGNGAVARVIMQAAAKHLTPLTLELGGKSPVYVHEDAKIDVAARRIMHTKLFNDGQVCIAPDYVLVHHKVKDQLIAALVKTLKTFHGEDPSKSTSLTKLINERHFDRVKSILDEKHGGKVIVGNMSTANRQAKYIPPTIVLDPSPTSRLLQEELFGPVLPIVTVNGLDEALKIINDKEASLASYVFTEDVGVEKKFIDHTTSGGTCVNDCVFHIASPHMPFGGIGPSGMGAYHGKAGFDEFTHSRAVMWRSTWLDPDNRYPPYKAADVDVLRKIVIGPLIPPHVKTGLKVAAVAAGAYMVLGGKSKL
jgi:aldehyde dehydrogenase (NAD+)